MSRNAHPAGPRHGDVLPEAQQSALPADVNALDPAIWPATATRTVTFKVTDGTVDVSAVSRAQGGGGRILNAASGQARQGFIFTPHYAASKFAVVGLTQSLAKELATEQITVNAYCPGIVGSDMWSYNDREWGRLLGDYKPGELMEEWVAGIPLGRAGTNDDVASLLLFLASDDAAYITGQTITVDGGQVLPESPEAMA